MNNLRLKNFILLTFIASIAVAKSTTVDPSLQAAVNAIVIPNATEIRGNITLPLSTSTGVTFTWSSDNESVIRSSESAGYVGYANMPGGVVTRQDVDVVVTLTVTGQKDGNTATRTIPVTVKAKNAQKQNVGYLYAYFSGDETRLDDQQIYFAISKDGVIWSDLNENNPVLKSVLGDLGVRDPYIIRSSEGDKFFLVATDLDIRASKYGGNWGNMSTKGSTSLMIWESKDLVNWSAQRMVDVSSFIGAGDTWAPEAIYDEKTGEYIVFWSSRVSTDSYAKHRIYVSKTRDFYTFTKPAVYVEGTSGVIDADMFKLGNTYYRLIKDEAGSNVYLSKSTSLLDYTNTIGLGNSFVRITNSELEGYTGGYEGPTMFQYINQNKWCALVDEYVNPKRGYIPFVSSDISATNSLHLLADGTYLMPTGAKHGTVIPINQQEYDALTAKWAVPDPQNDGDKTIVLKYDFNETLANKTVVDKSGSGYNATLYGTATYTTDATKGQVLYLDGTTGCYLNFPQGVFDGRDSMTISMDLRPESDVANHFTLGIGKNNYKYMFLRARTTEIRNAITTLSYGKERAVSSTGSFKSTWINVKIVMEGHKMSLYLNNKLIQSNSYVRSIKDLGTNLLAYLGKSFYSGDSYFKGYFDNVTVYNHALSASEITALTSGVRNIKKDLIRLSLNPTNKLLKVLVLESSTKNSVLQIYNSTGNLLFTKELAASQNLFLYSMNHLSSGVYLVKFERGNEMITERFII